MFVRQEVRKAIEGQAEQMKALLDLTMQTDPNTGDFILRARSGAVLCRGLATLLEDTADLSASDT